MYLKAMRMRLMWVGAMAFLLLFGLYWGGTAIFGPGTAVSIEWGIEPNLVGSAVEIDGKSSLPHYFEALFQIEQRRARRSCSLGCVTPGPAVARKAA